MEIYVLLCTSNNDRTVRHGSGKLRTVLPVASGGFTSFPWVPGYALPTFLQITLFLLSPLNSGLSRCVTSVFFQLTQIRQKHLFVRPCSHADDIQGHLQFTALWSAILCLEISCKCSVDILKTRKDAIIFPITSPVSIASLQSSQPICEQEDLPFISEA